MAPTRIDTYRVHSFDADLNGALSVSRLCGFMQESAWNHAEDLGVGYTHLFKRNLIWVLSRQFVRIAHLPRWGDSVVVETWPSGIDRMFCLRDFEIRDREGKVVVQATTSWFAIDIESRRPKLPQSYFDSEIPIRPSQFQRLQKLQLPTEFEARNGTRVRFSDLDVNGHANNVRYVEWCIESMPFDFIAKHRVSEIEVNFLAEALYGDQLVVDYAGTAGFEYLYSISKQDSHKEIGRTRILWAGS